MRAVGYRQVWEFLDGRIGEGELRSRAVAATRQLAKRQLTWLRGFTDVERVEPDADRLISRFRP
jgi:tRNA dimethylallyltransferase